MLSIVPILACAAMFAMMFGAGLIVWLRNRTPLGRPSWLARRANPKAQDFEHGSRS
jgi:uncharacterized membrane protein YeiB